MLRLLTLSLILVVALIGQGCGGLREAKIVDATRAETVILRKTSGRGAVHALSIIGEGSIAGTAEVQLILNSTVYRQEKISGAFRFEFGGDWYSDIAEVRYIPSRVSSESVTFKYDFKT